MKDKKLTALNFATLSAAVALFMNYENNGIEVSEYTLSRPELPNSADGLRILQISDLQNKRFGTGQKILLAKILKLVPDIILITGDIVDRRDYDIEPARELVHVLTKIAPTFYVPGNHEIWSGNYKVVKAMLSEEGVKLTENCAFSLNYPDGKINICGVTDPTVYEKGRELKRPGIIKESLTFIPKEGFNILLAHRPEFFPDYYKAGADIVFSGHVHGGQFRLPLLGGLYAPDQGVLPEYCSGLYRLGRCDMFVSRGLGNSSFPLRLFNRPELILVKLRK